MTPTIVTLKEVLDSHPTLSPSARAFCEGLLTQGENVGGHCGLLPAPSRVAGDHAPASPADAGGAQSAGGGEGHRPEPPGSPGLLTTAGDAAPASVYEAAAGLLAPSPEERP